MESDNSNNIPNYSMNDTEKSFASYISSDVSEEKINTLQKLNKEGEIESNKKNRQFYDLTLLEILIELKNTWFGILDELLSGNITMGILMKNDRLFYVGLTILIIAIILYIYDYMIEPDNSLEKILGGGNGIVEIRHIYDHVPKPN
jgi:hypothetical protein